MDTRRPDDSASDDHHVEPEQSSGLQPTAPVKSMTILPDENTAGNPRWKLTHSCFGLPRQLANVGGMIYCSNCMWTLQVETHRTRGIEY